MDLGVDGLPLDPTQVLRGFNLSCLIKGFEGGQSISFAPEKSAYRARTIGSCRHGR